MKYIKSIFTTCLIITIISHMAYGDCPDEVHAAIDASTNAAHLQNTMHQWGNKMNKECYFFIV
jgi:hypothetical protein